MELIVVFNACFITLIQIIISTHYTIILSSNISIFLRQKYTELKMNIIILYTKI